MKKGCISIYYGDSKKMADIAIGIGLGALAKNMKAIIVRFYEVNNETETYILKKLEPELKMFEFDILRNNVGSENESMLNEMKFELKSAINFCKKIMETEECDILILEGILDIASPDLEEELDLLRYLENRSSNMDIVFMGQETTPGTINKSDYSYRITLEKAKEETS